MHRHIRSFCVALALVATLAAVLAAAATAAPASRARLTGSVPKWATPAAFKAAAEPGQTLGFQVYLGWRNDAGAKALARAVSDPASRLYGRYLSPAKFRRLFAPREADVVAVRSWLRSQGFAIAGIPANNLYVPATGTVAQAQKAFGVRLNQYTVDGQTLRSPASALTIPASLSSIVTAVVGLDQSKAHPKAIADNAPPPAGFRNAQPWSTFWGQKIATDQPKAYGRYQPYAPRGYTPSQFRGAYGVAKAVSHGNDGSGVTVAIIDAYAAPTIVYDVNRYSHDNGVPVFKRGQFRQIVDPGLATQPPQTDESGWYGEETLDIEAVHGMAPGAKIAFLGALNSQDASLDVMMNYVIDHRLARIVSNSYGELGEQLPPELIKAENSIYLQAALEGIGIYFSSGDDGDEVDTLNYRTVDWPASSPWVTAVGGTSLGVGACNQYLFETGWGTGHSVLGDGVWTPAPPGDWWYGGGGGTSVLYGQPWYQHRVVPASIADYFDTGTNWRAVPDVAMDGDPTTGMLVGETQIFSGGVYYDTYRIGGTSLSCPLFAGVMALADQRARFPHGFANPALYRLARSHAYRDIVDPKTAIAAVRSDFVNGENDADGVSFTLRSMNDTESLHTIPGYDDVTGVGTPNGETFLNALR
jgi:subtilase family serine protease